MTSRSDVETRRQEVMLAVLDKIEKELNNHTAASIERYANAYALLRSGQPAAIAVEVNQK